MAAVSVFAAVVAWTLVTGPAAGGSDVSLCALARTRAHHSEGVSAWNPAYPRAHGDVDALMVFLAFPDAAPAMGPEELASDHFPATTRFFERASYGNFRLRPHILPYWLRMPAASTDYGIGRDWNPAMRARFLRDAVVAADRRVDFSRYAVVYLVADPDAPGVDPDATKVVNLGKPVRIDGADLRRFVTVFESHPPDVNVLAHETGHAFDLPDLYYRPPVGSNADWDTHVGDWDLMGSQFGLAPDLFAWHKWKLGWLDRTQVRCVTEGGTHTFRLSPVEQGGGTKLLVLPAGLDGVVAIEARAALGNDRLTCSQGVLMYRVRSGVQSGDGPVDVIDAHPGSAACQESSVYPPLADAPLGVGETFALGRSARVHVADHHSDGSWTVQVTQG
ncbi:M6 family metalloprotease domain-containing protein [Streptomyces sp. NPDC026673]|uniref:M6 family metalloprotease domain-containing protein n=1 Tax=Streptomyces sp. NPDC026673 TaxID=3155724 RepID=UPI0034081EAE